jgi:HEAT repeat protein
MRISLSFLCIVQLLLLPFLEAKAPKSVPKPDFTKGDEIPKGATHDWNLGATGLRGWMHSEKSTTTEARQIKVTKVDPKSPSDGIIKLGDVILGVDGKLFAFDPRVEFGRALTAAEAGDGKLDLVTWRDGNPVNVTVQLQTLGSYSKTSPYACAKSAKILELGCEALAKRMESPNYNPGTIPRALNALALLASGEGKYLPLVKREAEWGSKFQTTSMATWHYGYVIMLLAEYHMVTGDESILPGLKRLAMESAEGQSIVGSWGHKFAGEDGRLVGYGMMNAPGVPLTISLVMARTAGVKDAKIDLAIERSAKLLRFYTGKGAVPYGDHHPWTQTHEDNGKSGMAAVLFNLMEEKKPTEFFSKMALASHGNERDLGHTGNFWNMNWAMPAVNLSGPQATGAWMQEFGAWYYDLARNWDWKFIHQGPPAVDHDHTRNWETSGSFLLAYAMPLKKIWLTGAKKGLLPPLTEDEAQAVIHLGKGWTNADRNSSYDKLSNEELIEKLSSWSPVVQIRAAEALVRNKKASVETMVNLLKSEKTSVRLGACYTLNAMKQSGESAVPALVEALKDEDLWVRVQAANALGSMGQAGFVGLPKLLETIVLGPTQEDPRGMEQRFMTFVVFNQMLSRHSLEGVDRDLLFKAIKAGLKNEDGRSRGAIASVYNKFSYEEIKPLLPAIHEAIVVPSPSGIMFSDTIRLAGVNLLAKHRIEEGIPLSIKLMDIERWNKKSRIESNLKTLESYGPAAKQALPEMRELLIEFKKHSEKNGLVEQITLLSNLIAKLEKEDDSKIAPLRSLK